MIPEEKLIDPNHYVFLLTDDAGAIKEAHEFFPNINGISTALVTMAAVVGGKTKPHQETQPLKS